MLRAAIIPLMLMSPSGLSAKVAPTDHLPSLELHLANLGAEDAALKAARTRLPECEPGCLTPGEATAMALSAGEGVVRKGRFLLDIRGGGQSIHGELGQLLFVNSRQDYATLGTLTVAFEPDALQMLLRRARVCGAVDVTAGQIDVKGCRADGVGDLNMFTMIQRLGGRRIVVEGEMRLQWIDWHMGRPHPAANKRGEHERGYYQVWVRVAEPEQVIFVYDE